MSWLLINARNKGKDKVGTWSNSCGCKGAFFTDNTHDEFKCDTHGTVRNMEYTGNSAYTNKTEDKK